MAIGPLLSVAILLALWTQYEWETQGAKVIKNLCEAGSSKDLQCFLSNVGPHGPSLYHLALHLVYLQGKRLLSATSSREALTSAMTAIPTNPLPPFAPAIRPGD